jgi:hypothetical protein
MNAVWIALIAAAAVIGGPLLVAVYQNKRLDRIAEVSAATLRRVHNVEKLADGSLTAAYRAELAAVEAQVVAMRRPLPDTQAAIKAAEKRVEAMRKALVVREAALESTQEETSELQILQIDRDNKQT